MAASRRSRASSPASVITTVFTRRSVGEGRRSTKPRSSSLSTMEVTKDASQCSSSASTRMGGGDSTLREMRALP